MPLIGHRIFRMSMYWPSKICNWHLLNSECFERSLDEMPLFSKCIFNAFKRSHPMVVGDLRCHRMVVKYSNGYPIFSRPRQFMGFEVYLGYIRSTCSARTVLGVYSNLSAIESLVRRFVHVSPFLVFVIQL